MSHFGNYIKKFEVKCSVFSPGRVLPKFNSNIWISYSIGFDIPMAGKRTENGFGISTGRYMYGYGIFLKKLEYGYGMGKSYFLVMRYGTRMGK